MNEIQSQSFESLFIRFSRVENYIFLWLVFPSYSYNHFILFPGFNRRKHNVLYFYDRISCVLKVPSAAGFYCVIVIQHFVPSNIVRVCENRKEENREKSLCYPFFPASNSHAVQECKSSKHIYYRTQICCHYSSAKAINAKNIIVMRSFFSFLDGYK